MRLAAHGVSEAEACDTAIPVMSAAVANADRAKYRGIIFHHDRNSGVFVYRLCVNAV